MNASTEVAEEVAAKEGRVRRALEELGLDGLLLRRVSSFAWATGGQPSYVSSAVDVGEAALLFAPDGRHLFTNEIEAPRFEQELRLADQGWKIHASPWYAPSEMLPPWAKSLKIGVDGALPGLVDVSSTVSALRAALMPAEAARFRRLGELCAQAMSAAVARVRPGQTEHAIAATIAGELLVHGVMPVVLQVATDERVSAFRHVLPTDRRLQRHAMLSFCGRKAGLVASVTRLVHFGRLSDELRRKQDAAAAVDATLIAGTRPGARISDLFARAAARYAAEGFPDEWRRHHQGGAAGYEPREYVATPTSTEIVQQDQAFAWNPSLPGAKSEDTILVGESDAEVLTAMKDWPMLTVDVDGRPWQRPAILEVT